MKRRLGRRVTFDEVIQELLESGDPDQTCVNP
jgi:hypothetical protein